MGPLGRASSASSFPLSLVHSPESRRLCSEVSHHHVLSVCINAVGVIFPVAIPNLFPIKEVLMIAVSKIACILACGFVLGVGLSAQTTWAGDGTKSLPSCSTNRRTCGAALRSSQTRIGLNERTSKETAWRTNRRTGRATDTII